jgi:hypothetical protein
MRMVTGRTVAAGLVSAVVLLGAACSEDGDGGNPLAGADETASQGGAGEQGSGSGGEDEGDGSGGTGGSGSGSGGGRPDAGAGRDAEALASSEAQLPADPGNETLVPLTLEVTRLARSGDLVELEVRLVNDGEDGGPSYEPWDAFSGQTAGDYTISGTGLVDPDGQKMYLPAWDSEGYCVCSGDLLDIAIPPGESYLLTASIGGVPEDVGPVDLHFPRFPVITGLEIEG